MIYEVNGDLRSSMLIDGTAEARLADILTIMDKRTFPKRESERIVGGPGRLKTLVSSRRVLNILALPCLAMFNDVDPVTGDWNYTVNLFGIVYSVWFYHKVLKKIIKI